MSYVAARTFVAGELMAARYYRDAAADGDYLLGRETDQAEIDISDDSMSVAGTIGATEDFDALELVALPDDTAGIVAFAGYKASIPAASDAVDIILGLYDSSGPTTEPLARLRFSKAASILGRGQVEFNVYSSGSVLSPAAMVFSYERLTGVFVSNPAYGVDVDGDFNAEGYVGLTTWGENPSGTAYHSGGDAEITGQWISTATTGTVPVQVPVGSPTCRNLNADNMAGKTWGGAALTDTGTANVSSIDTSYEIASVTTSDAGLYEIAGEATATMDSSDAGAKFEFWVTGADAWTAMSDATSGGLSHGCAFSMVTATAAQTLYFYVRKNGGSGTTSVAGSMIAQRIG